LKKSILCSWNKLSNCEGSFNNVFEGSHRTFRDVVFKYYERQNTD
jgi:hypothetical protein